LIAGNQLAIEGTAKWFGPKRGSVTEWIWEKMGPQPLGSLRSDIQTSRSQSRKSSTFAIEI